MQVLPSKRSQERNVLQLGRTEYHHLRYPQCVRIYPDILTLSEEERILTILNPRYPQAPTDTKIAPSEKVSLLQKQMISQWGTFMTELTGLKPNAPINFRLGFQILDPKNQINWRSDGLVVMINLGAEGSLLFRNKHEPTVREWSIVIPRRSLLVLKDPFLDYERYAQAAGEFRYTLSWALSTQVTKYAYDIPSSLSDCVMDSEILIDYDENGQLLISSYQLERWTRDYTPEKIIQSLMDIPAQFPYLKYYMERRPELSISLLVKRLQELDSMTRVDRRLYTYLPGVQNRNTDLFSYRFEFDGSNPTVKEGFSCTLVTLPNDFWDYDTITNYFTEDARMHALVNKGNISRSFRLCPLDWWYSDWKQGLYNRLIQQKQSIHTLTLHEELRYFVAEATQFKVSMALSVIRLLTKGIDHLSILDFSAGWGDRLIAAIVSGAERYVGYDPNDRLIRGHREIINGLAEFSARGQYEVRPEPFETSQWKGNETFDLVFTSPPYFTFEQYSMDPTQSAIAYPEYEDWLVSFLYRSLSKSWAVLREKGHMAIHIADTKDMPNLCTLLLLFVQGLLPGAYYRGVISSQARDELEKEDGAKPRRPIWVFQKRAQNAKIAREAENRLKKFYKSVYIRYKEQEE
jgi:hypothetical protein